MSFQIETIEQAWQWVATLGAALGLPTALRWLWWRVTATSEIVAMAGGLATAIVLVAFTEMSYESRLIWISAVSAGGMLVGLATGPSTATATLERFQRRVRPVGLWPGGHSRGRLGQALLLLALWLSIVAGVALLLVAVRDLLFFPGRSTGWALLVLACATLGWGLTQALSSNQDTGAAGRAIGSGDELEETAR